MTYPAPARRRWIPGGRLGVAATLQEMRKAVRAGLHDPLTLEAAGRIVSKAATDAERARRIRAWLEAYVDFLPDPVGLELIRTPRYMLDRVKAEGYAQGDCDDVAVLAAALGQAVGLPARWVLLSFAPGAPASHVYTELATGEGWMDMDTTAPDQFPPGLEIHRRYTREV